MPSPTFPMSSCLTGGGSIAYRFDLDIVTKSSSPSPRSSQSSPSSTLSEISSSTPLFISTKRPRAPRKRPNQCSAEAAALLSTIYPKLFSTTNFRQPTFLFQQPPDDPFPVLLPSFPIPSEGSLILVEPPSPERPPNGLLPRAAKEADAPICSPQDFHFRDPGSPDFDAESILDEEADQGIDSIMGNLSMNTNLSNDSNGDCPSSNTNSILNLNVASLMSFGLSGRFGFGFGISSNMRGALRQSDDGEWWRSPKVSVNEIVSKFREPTVKSAVVNKKKKKKKVEKEETMVAKVSAAVSPPQDGILKPKLGLNLNYDGILKEWTGGSPFSGEACSPESAADAIALLGDIDLFPDTVGGAVREARMQRYKDKRRNRLFSKKIRYQVRKVNAEQRPRMKGRFARTPSLVQEAMAEGSTQGVCLFA